MATTQVQTTPTAPAPARAGRPDMLRTFRGEMDRLFDHFFTGFSLPSLSFPELPRLPMPASDVTETDTAWRVTAELPGMSEKDVELALSGDTLTIKGEKREESTRKEANTTLCERSYGAFERSFLLPEGIDRDKIEAQFDKGVLTVTLPKTPAAQQQTRKIDVKPAAG